MASIIRSGAFQLLSAHFSVVSDGKTFSCGLAVATDVLRLAVLVPCQIIGAGVVWNPVLQYIGVGFGGVSPLAAAVLFIRNSK